MIALSAVRRNRDLRLLATVRRPVSSRRGAEECPSPRPFVTRLKNALPAKKRLLDLLLGELKRILPPGALDYRRHPAEDWIGRMRARTMRRGLEDKIRVSKHQPAVSSAELVGSAVERVLHRDRDVAKPDAARELLSLAT